METSLCDLSENDFATEFQKILDSMSDEEIQEGLSCPHQPFIIPAIPSYIVESQLQEGEILIDILQPNSAPKWQTRDTLDSLFNKMPVGSRIGVEYQGCWPIFIKEEKLKNYE